MWVPFGAAHWPAKLISCSQDSHSQAIVELFGTGLKTEVAASGLTAFADGCADKCQQLHSKLGRQVSWPMQMPCVRYVIDFATVQMGCFGNAFMLVTHCRTCGFF